MKFEDIAPFAGCQPEIGVLGAALIDSSREWRGELGEVSEDAIVWQPRPGGHSIGAELLHIAEVEIYWIHHFIAGQPMDPEEMALLMSAEIRVDEGLWPTPPRRPLAWYLEKLDSVRERSLALLPTFADPARVIPSRRDPEYGMTVRWVLGHVVQHDSYHGGQAVLLKDLATALDARPLSP